MALQVIATDVASDGVTASKTVSGPCTILMSGTLGSAEVEVEVSGDGTLWSFFARTDAGGINPPAFSCIMYGSYQVRLRIRKASGTNLTFKVNQ